MQHVKVPLLPSQVWPLLHGLGPGERVPRLGGAALQLADGVAAAEVDGLAKALAPGQPAEPEGERALHQYPSPCTCHIPWLLGRSHTRVTASKPNWLSYFSMCTERQILQKA